MTTVEELRNLIDRWKVNRAPLASKLNMKKGTFNNKLSANHNTQFTDKELNQLCNVLIEMGNELTDVEKSDFNETLKIISQNQP